MRAIMFVSGTALLIAIGALLVWRPATILALALLGGAVNLWRMHRPHRTPRPAVTERPSAATADPVAPLQPHDGLLDRIRDAGWTLHPARSSSPWLIAVGGGVRVALRPGSESAQVTADDITEAMAAKAADGAQYVAIICEDRPSEDVAAMANENRIHIVSMLRLEAYLALAHSFKPPQPVATLNRALA